MVISQHHGNGPKYETFGSPIFIEKDFDIFNMTMIIMMIIMIMILPLCISEGDRLDVMILVILNKDSKDCVSTQGGVDQEIALVPIIIIIIIMMIVSWF